MVSLRNHWNVTQTVTAYAVCVDRPSGAGAGPFSVSMNQSAPEQWFDRQVWLVTVWNAYGQPTRSLRASAVCLNA